MNNLKFAWLLAVSLLVSTSFAQNFSKYYPDPNTIAGYANAVYDIDSKTYFLVELDHDISINFNSAFHVKQVDESGNLINHKYYPSDFLPWSGHYISTIEMQGEDIVIFLNRNVGYPHVHDAFVIRIDKSLAGAYSSKRLYLTGSNPNYNSLKINECVQYSGKIIFTGSVFTQDYMDDPAAHSKLLMGMIDVDGSIHYDVFERKYHEIEGLSLLPSPKEGAVYVSCRYTEKEGKEKDIEIPLILRLRVSSSNHVSYYWGKSYPTLRMDISHKSSSYNEGIEVPLIQSLTPYKAPAFIARDKSRENIVVVPFNRINGDHYIGYVRRIFTPKNMELIDAVKFPKKKNGIAVLFTRKEPWNLVNTESHLVTCKNLYSFFSQVNIHDLNSPVFTNSIQARRILLPSDYKLAVAGMGNRVELPLSGLYRASIMQSDNLSFGCVTRKGLKKPKPYSFKGVKTPVYKVHFTVKIVDREMGIPYIEDVTEYDFCDEKGARIKTDVDQTNTTSISFVEVSVYPNPASDFVNIVIPQSDEGNRNIVIRNITGAIVYQQEIGNYDVNIRVNTSEFTQGIYILSLGQNEQTIDTKRIIISH